MEEGGASPESVIMKIKSRLCKSEVSDKALMLSVKALFIPLKGSQGQADQLDVSKALN